MANRIDDILRQVRELEPLEREALLDLLLAEMGDEPDPAAVEACDDELKAELFRRLDRIERGEEELIPWDELRAEFDRKSLG